jgi:hypothetical protein
MKIVNWKRFLTFVAIIILFAILILHQCSKKTPELTGVESHTFVSGETLWGVATQYRPQDMSIQEYIYNVKEYNGIGSTVYAGQTIYFLIY